ncbi:MAG: hypothetical protein IJ424_03135 [Oscillospiraceae bacterium]|nr:hypothetical protein [Oscillospiraceae bacterium]
MKMKTLSKALLVSLCAVLLVAASVLGTLAYLTSSDAVTNTFTVGKVAITLDETEVDEYGVAGQNPDRVKENTYKLIPGKTYTKDPTIHVNAESEKCWLFVKIENGLEGVATINGLDGWTLVDDTTDIYAFERVVTGNENVAVFATFTVDSDATEAELTDLADETIVVTAYAVQADGFATAADAWNGANSQFN